MNFIPRPSQELILAYQQGRMGISAVPGSGKTFTLSVLAAQLLLDNRLDDTQEVLVVTLVNAAVQNFYNRVSALTQAAGLLPGLGYRVRTLHGLARDILQRRPELAGLDNDFQIVDERETSDILTDLVNSWMRNHPNGLAEYLDPHLAENKIPYLNQKQIPALLKDTAAAFIRSAKDAQMSPEQLRSRLPAGALPLAHIGLEFYEDYQRALAYRSAVDFDDLIRLALGVLQSDPTLHTTLRQEWPYILEDEAQDSSSLQQAILSLLTGQPDGNWVRVGDPNQAIYESFTTAKPNYLLEFIQQPGTQGRELPESGRCSPSIIRLANYLIEWVITSHPNPAARDALKPPYIQPTPPGDPQPNPPDSPDGIHLSLRSYTSDAEIGAVVKSLQRWLAQPANQQRTVAVLCPNNRHAEKLVNELRRLEIKFVDSLLRSSSETRLSAGALANILRYLSDPQSPGRLATVYAVWRRADRDIEEARQRMDAAQELIKKCPHVEDYLWPTAERDWLAGLLIEDPILLEDLHTFRLLVHRWQAAVLLPVDQIVLTLAQDLLTEPAQLANAHKMAGMLRQASQMHPDWGLTDLTEELTVIAKNERRYLGLGQDDTNFDPDAYPGQVVVATMHKAKGLEWDRVYLLSVNNYDFPSGLAGDSYIPEKWFVRDQLNLSAEALAQLATLTGDNHSPDWYLEGQATDAARLDYIRERLRLLYVGITRARQELIITWNTGREGPNQKKQTAAVALVALHDFLESGTR